jgi:hypothetical protein
MQERQRYGSAHERAAGLQLLARDDEALLAGGMPVLSWTFLGLDGVDGEGLEFQIQSDY